MRSSEAARPEHDLESPLFVAKCRDNGSRWPSSSALALLSSEWTWERRRERKGGGGWRPWDWRLGILTSSYQTLLHWLLSEWGATGEVCSWKKAENSPEVKHRSKRRKLGGNEGKKSTISKGDAD